MAGPFRLTVRTRDVVHLVPLAGVSERSYEQVTDFLSREVRAGYKGRETIASAFGLAVDLCPDANSSDLWHHIIYRHYLTLVGSQSWVRTSGEAFEVFLCRHYNAILEAKGIRLTPLFAGDLRKRAFKTMKIPAGMGTAKLDIAVEGSLDLMEWSVLGGIHAKVSLAERVTDDVPMSGVMMKRGYWSPLCTLDVKSYPPKDLTNHGELGTPAKPSDKREYFEKKGSFSACYSYNLRTVPSPLSVPEGKRIYRLTFKKEMDRLCEDALAARKERLGS